MSEPETPVTSYKTRPPTFEEMNAYVHGLGPDSEVYSGRKYFAALLKKGGLSAVLDFMERGSNALAVGDQLDPYYDFTPVEREVLARTPIKRMSRRAFLSVLPGIYFAGVEGTSATLKVGAQISEAATGKRNEAFNYAHHWVEDTLQPSANLAIAVVVGNEMHELVRNWKLEQIADALGELRDNIGFKTKAERDEEALRATLVKLGDAVEQMRAALEAQKQTQQDAGSLGR